MRSATLASAAFGWLCGWVPILLCGLVLAAAPGLAQAGDTAYSYDALGRLTQTTVPSSTVAYTYDAAGNRVSQTIACPNCPVANADSITVAENGSASFNPTTNDTDPLGYSLSITALGSPAHGAATYSGNTVTYTPASGYVGSDTFSYTVSDGHGNSASGVVSATVSSLAPVAGAVSQTVAYNSANTAIVLNLSGGAATSVTVSTPASHGTATASGTSITYTPTSGYTGADSFAYTASNSAGTSSPATVTITVSAQLPMANAVNASVTQNSSANPIPLSITGGTPTSVAVSTQATHGAATASGTSITYTPTSGYSGPDSFAYTASNSAGTSSPATVTITVNPQAPVANAVSATVAYGSSNNPITLSITGGTATSVAVSTQAAHGAATASGTSIRYTPTSGYAGPDSFAYTASNSAGTSSPATVTITVSAQAPVAGAVSATVAYGSSNNPITLSITGGTATSVAVSTQAAHGVATASGTSIRYTPTSGYSGPDSFYYTASNAGGTSAAAKVTITVNPQAPVANAVSATVIENTSANPIALNITGGAATSVAVSTAASHGTATASGTSIIYTPTSGYSGTDSFYYTATGAGGTSAAAKASISVNAAANPTAVNDLVSTVDAATSVGFDPRTNDSDPNGYPLTITAIAAPAFGTATLNGGTSITYYLPGGNGPYSVVMSYTISNGHGGSATATITINVRATHG